MALLPMQDFVTLCTYWYLKNTGSLSYVQFQKLTHSFYYIQKIISLISPPILLGKFFKCGEAVKLMVADA